MMHLTRRISARTKTIKANWCKLAWMEMSDTFRNIRAKSGNKMDKCFWCKYKFKNGDTMALAGFTKGNRVLCQDCAEELMNES